MNIVGHFLREDVFPESIHAQLKVTRKKEDRIRKITNIWNQYISKFTLLKQEYMCLIQTTHLLPMPTMSIVFHTNLQHSLDSITKVSHFANAMMAEQTSQLVVRVWREIARS
jgi:hypothetical protein